MHLDDVTLIQRAMRNLPSRARSLLQLREMQGLSYRELAEATGTPLGTVMSGLSRARHAFRHALEHELNRASRP
jgi:RNA polymerase sigma-70 factor (ECF subfamily)